MKMLRVRLLPHLLRTLGTHPKAHHPFWCLPRLLHTNSTSAPSNFKVGSASKPLKDAADTVIIGGGVVGCSIAYHLAKRGLKDVLLLEKSELTAGSTWHAAGLVALYHPGINVKNIHYYSINLYSQLESETGVDVGFHRPGSLRLATSPLRLEEMNFQMSRQGWQKAPQRLVTPEEIHQLCPILNMDKILGGLYNPYDGHIDPYSLTQALAKGARKYGATLAYPVQVTGMRLRFDGLWEVDTSRGGIRAKRVVNAAGLWAREVGLLAGLELPLVPVHHQYMVTDSVPEVEKLDKEIPVLRHLDGSFYLRQERKGLLVGPYESEKSMKICEDWAKVGVPPGFGKELFETDLERLTPHLSVAMDLVPAMSTASIRRVICGPITYSPDLLPLLGPSSLPGLWLAVGFGYGIIHAGGVGKYLSEWLIEGEPPYDLIELDPLRFGAWADMGYTLDKARESYGMNNAVAFPLEERMAGRPTRRLSGVHQDLAQRGAHMNAHSGWEQPAWFALPDLPAQYQPSFRRTNWHKAVGNECARVMNKVGVIDLAPFAKLEVIGPDATKFLDKVTANAVPKPGRTCISHCLTPRGRVYAELTITCLAEGSFFVVTGSGSELHDLRWLQMLARDNKFDVSFQNVTEEKGCLSIAGPKSQELLRRLTSDNVNKFPFLTARKMKLADVDVLALRITYTGELGWEFYCDRRDTKQLYDTLLKAGDDLGLGDFGTHALNVLRMEKGFRMWGAEMNLDTTPLEAGLHSFLRFDKGTFIGREALISVLQQGLNKHLVMLSIESDDVDPFGNESIWCEGKVVGNTTSGCFSHTTDQVLAFAYLPPFLSVPGTNVMVQLLDKHCPAKVLPGPPVVSQPMREKKKLEAKC